MQTITRTGTFDSAHRVMNEAVKCFNIHGHTYKYELTFSFKQIQKIGYCIDFKEIKRIACQWIDDYLDHAIILNPLDDSLLKTAYELKSKIWIMSLNGKSYCNPTVENIVKEIFLAMKILFVRYNELKIHHIRLYETPNCYTDCNGDSISIKEEDNFYAIKGSEIIAYANDKGMIDYYLHKPLKREKNGSYERKKKFI